MESKPDSLSLFPGSSYFASGCVTGGGILPHRGRNKISCDKCKQDNQDKETWRRVDDFREECLDLPDQITFELRSGGTSGKEPACQPGDIRDVGLIPGLRRSPGGGHDNPLQYPCLENPMDRGTWQATVHRVAKSEVT